MPRSPWLLTTLLLTVSASDTAAQDVEMLGRRYGTRPPAGYYEAMRRDPTAFQFRRGWSGGRLEITSLDGASSSSAPMLGLVPPTGPVVGDFAIPVVLGMYSNSGGTPPFTRAAIQAGYFGGGPGTIDDYYAEVSGGRVALIGDVAAWVQVARPDTAYTVGESGLVGDTLGGGGAGNFVWDVLELNPAIDWAPYDNDGPDGVPNSGDDDGFVDVLAVIQPTRGGECGGTGKEDRIWSHRWSLSYAVGTPFVTSTPAAGGGSIRIDDYTIQASISCAGGGLNQIGVFAHELGHAFGLPDLYDTCSDAEQCPEDTFQHAGAGVWDLMASGTWGCAGASPASPCHMGAWSKAILGWVDVVTLAPDTDHGTLTLPPVETAGTVYRVDANDGSGEYFLLENRQRIGYDQQLYAEGLLVWQIDPDWVSARWGLNRVNANEHMGVWLRQADGLDDLGTPGRGRGDAGDPFPGQSGNPAFHAVTNPAAISYGGGVTGLTVFDIKPVPGVDDVELRLLTRFTTMTVRADGAAGTTGLFTLNGIQVDPPATTFTSAPFVEHAIEAIVGEPVQAGERRPFLQWLDQWLDAPSEARSRVVSTPVVDSAEYVAGYGGTEFELALSTSGGVNGIVPGSFVSQPPSEDLWFGQGLSATVEAVPRTGFAFLGWTGALAGQANPASFTMSGPLAAGADFDLIYGVASTAVQLPAATQLDVQLEVENGTAPYAWTLVGGEMPLGLEVSRAGRITGAALETGVFDVTFQAVDAIGLPATGTVALDVVDPQIPIEQLASPFLLTGPRLSAAQVNFLNLQGNGIAPYDVGDFRAWVLSHPSLPLSANFKALLERKTIVLPMQSEAREEIR
jgi:M6 family metalloprotease-like protein